MHAFQSIVPDDSSTHLTGWLRRWTEGDPTAAEAVFRKAQNELRVIASRCLRHDRQLTLQPTVLINEAYLSFHARSPVDWKNRQQFLAYSARIMRQILVDHARSRMRAKRGSGAALLSLEEEWMEERGRGEGLSPAEILDVHQALQRLAEEDEQKAAVVELRFFAGLSTDGIASVLEISRVTVLRQWRRAKAWLFTQLKTASPVEPAGSVRRGAEG